MGPFIGGVVRATLNWLTVHLAAVPASPITTSIAHSSLLLHPAYRSQEARVRSMAFVQLAFSFLFGHSAVAAANKWPLAKAIHASPSCLLGMLGMLASSSFDTSVHTLPRGLHDSRDELASTNWS